MFPIKAGTISIIKNYIDFNYDIVFIGIPETQIFCKEIIASWKFFLEELLDLEQIEYEKKINDFYKEMEKYIKLQNKKSLENLAILNIYNVKIKKDLNKVCKIKSPIELCYYEKFPNFRQMCIGDKNTAIKYLKELKSDLNLKAILIPPHQDWNKIIYWSKATRKALNKYRKDFSLSQEAINLNGQLYLSYISPYNIKKSYGSLQKIKETYILSLANQKYSLLKSTIAHEYTHIFDQCCNQKYYKKNSELVFKGINSFLSIELLNQVQRNVNSSSNDFIDQYKKILVSIVSDYPYENYSEFYKQNMGDFKEKLKTKFVEIILEESLDNDLWEKNKHVVFSHRELNAQIEKIISEPDLRKETTLWIKQLYTEINNSEGILNCLNQIFKLKKNNFSYLNNNNELLVEKIFNNFKEIIKDKKYFLFDNYLYGNNAFGTSDYMKKILNYSFKNNATMNYWTSIKEVIARHVQEVYPEKKHELNHRSLFNPVLTNNEKFKYKSLIKNMAVYADFMPNHNNEKNMVYKK